MKFDAPRTCPDCGGSAVVVVAKFNQGGMPAQRLRCACGTAWVQVKVTG